jgi:predicted Rossmann fold nucleotide-binding protein DprA/Smf involved in DNA uptake
VTDDARALRDIGGAEIAGVLPPRPRLAIVGSRAAHKRFRQLVPIAIEQLQALGWALVSGGALGIDGDAHRAALAVGVAQLAVLPCGPDRPYPPGHRDLFAAMLADGRSAILYCQPSGRAPTTGMFVSRNRHVVAIADAVLVIEAAQPSGTLYTGRQALRRGIPTAAVIGSRGAAVLIGRGARALPPEPAPFATALRDWLSQRASDDAAWPIHLSPLRDELAAASPQGIRIDRSPDPIATACALTEAELLGLVVESAPGVWVKTGAG